MPHILTSPSALIAPQLEVRDLRVVVALARAGTTSAAADLLHLSQSAVSRALAVAESRLGQPLFRRTPRGLVPTDAGTLVLEAAPGMLADLAALERRVREPLPRPTKVRLVAECHMAYPWLTRVVLRLRRAAPSVRLELPLEHSKSAHEALLQGKLDAALLTSRAPAGIPSREMFEDEMVFVVSESHPLASRGSLRPRDVAKGPLLVPTARSSDAWFMRQVFGSRRPRVHLERLAVTEAIIEIARAGLGIAVLSEWITASYLALPGHGLTTLRLAKGPLLRRWRLAYRPELAPTVPLLADALLGSRPCSATRLQAR